MHGAGRSVADTSQDEQEVNVDYTGCIRDAYGILDLTPVPHVDSIANHVPSQMTAEFTHNPPACKGRAQRTHGRREGRNKTCKKRDSTEGDVVNTNMCYNFTLNRVIEYLKTQSTSG